MFTISNIYGHGFDQRWFSKLETLGFKGRSQVSTYLGAQICRFVDFQEGPCLEVIEVEDDKEYLDFIPDGMIPYCPGISLILDPGSNTIIGDFEERFQGWRPYTLHLNYDGSTASRGPGWNYLNFGLSVVRDTFIWLTELEDPRPRRNDYETNHPNSVTGVAGLVFDLEVESLKNFSQLVAEEIEAGAFSIGGVQVWSKRAVADLPDLPQKVFPLVAIILKAKGLDYFETAVDGIRKVSFKSRPAIHVETNKLSWDLLITT